MGLVIGHPIGHCLDRVELDLGCHVREEVEHLNLDKQGDSGIEVNYYSFLQTYGASMPSASAKLKPGQMATYRSGAEDRVRVLLELLNRKGFLDSNLRRSVRYRLQDKGNFYSRLQGHPGC